MKNYYKGLLAEQLAKIILLLKGYRIIKSRYKIKLGEIDIIAKKKDIIIFFEVKQRKNKEDFLEAIHPAQKKRIIRTSNVFLQKYNHNNCNIRYDVIFISLPFYFQHIKNAFL